ncbi:MAG: biopolymer transporter ExbD [Planctomycetia bacterium]|nr:biopolymer transporter ExbD [Planctomycetia bacterium]
MPVTFRCSECTQKLRIEDSQAGKLVSCVRCGAKQRVPFESSPEFAKPKGEPAKQKSAADVPAPPAPPASPARPAPSKPPPTFKPWQPQPVREEPLPSEKVEPEVQEHKVRERDTPPGELSHEALSAIFDEPIEFESLPSEPKIRKPLREVLRETVGRPAEPDLPQEPPQDEPELNEGVAEGAVYEAPRSSSPEFDPAPLVAAGSRHFEEAPVASDYESHEGQAAAAVAHAEPSMVPPAKKLDVEEMIDMTAMVDIVFFLLIFFLVTSMHTLDSTIPMPVPDPQKGAAKEPQTVAAIDADDSYVVVRVDKNDKITVEGAEVRSERELLFKLQQLRREASRPEKLLVIGHGDATHGTAVMILDAGRELGMEHVKLTVQDEEE